MRKSEQSATTSVEAQIQLIKAQQEREMALTPMGQMLNNFKASEAVAKMYAASSQVPKQYQGKVGECMIALDMASRMNASLLMVMQNLYVVHGTPSFSTKFLIACVNSSGRFSPLRYQFRGTPGTDDYACRCVAYEAADKEHKEPLEGTWVSLGMAKKEGWSTKEGSKWKTMPGQMMRYRAAAFWQRIYCPEISMGFISTEEAQDSVQDVSFEEVPADNAAAKVAEAIKAANASNADVDVETGEVKQ